MENLTAPAAVPPQALEFFRQVPHGSITVDGVSFQSSRGGRRIIARDERGAAIGEYTRSGQPKTNGA